MKLKIILQLTLSTVCLGLLVAANVSADPFPPTLPGAEHYLVRPWPAENLWIPMTHNGNTENDKRTIDESHGGARPQNYVNVASSCIDETLPSIYYYFDGTTIFFRWRVEQIANNYTDERAYQSGSPWNSALWTVFFDTDGDGYREFAMHLDGSSGSPSAPIDMINTIYSNTPSQSINYLEEPDIYLIDHNPTAFVDLGTGYLLNYQNSFTPVATWPVGAQVWDYGPTRSINLNPGGCEEYLVDYQIPLAMLDASATTRTGTWYNGLTGTTLASGPKITEHTPLSMFFATANSLNDPLQKDAVLKGCAFIPDVTRELPFGDYMTLDKGILEQPVIDVNIDSGCGPVIVTSQIVKDAINCVPTTSVDTSIDSVIYYQWFDANTNGLPDETGGEWIRAAAGQIGGGVQEWNAQWQTSSLEKGQYLVGAQATDHRADNFDGNSHRTFSYLTQAECDAKYIEDGSPANMEYYANPIPEPGLQWGIFQNDCGIDPPYITKAVSDQTIAVGDNLTVTVTVVNKTSRDITIDNIQDILPDGFTYILEAAGGDFAGNVTGYPLDNATGTITFTLDSPTVPGTSNPAVPTTRTLTFRIEATAPAVVVGAYTNTATAYSPNGGTPANDVDPATDPVNAVPATLVSNPVPIGVGAPRLTIAKEADAVSYSPGGTITYTITYSNDSTIDANNVVLTDVVPSGLTFVSATNGGTESGGTITWNLGSLASGEGPFTVQFQATVANPFPDALDLDVVNTASIDSDETDPETASVTVFIAAPRPNMVIQKDANVSWVDATTTPNPQSVVYTIYYENTGPADATNVSIVDTTPVGFNYQASSLAPTSAPAVGSSGTITWTITDPAGGTAGTVAAGQSGSFTVTMESSTSAVNPTVNTATVNWFDGKSASDSYTIGVFGGYSCASTTYYFVDSVSETGYAMETTPGAGGDPAPSTDSGVLPKNQWTYVESFFTPAAPSPGWSISYVDITLENFSTGANTYAQIILYEYNPTTNTRVTTLSTFSGNQEKYSNGTGTENFDQVGAIDGPHAISTGNMLEIAFYADPRNGNNETVSIYRDGASDISQADICFATLPVSIIDKQVYDGTLPLSIPNEGGRSTTPGATLLYSIDYTNPNPSSITSAYITDTLPTGLSYITGSATMNGGSISDPTISGSLLTFNPVTGSGDAPAGTISTFNSGTIQFRVQVDSPINPAITLLDNSASLYGTYNSQALDVEIDNAKTVVTRPVLSISKKADKTLLYGTGIDADRTVTYTITVLNTGDGTATGLQWSDTIPVSGTDFTYVAGSLDATTTTGGVGPTSDDSGSPNLTAGLTSLASGGSWDITFQMRAASPLSISGVTEFDNSAAVQSDQTASVNSNTVTVAVSANPNLRISKSSSPAGPHSPGDELTYTLTVENVGSSAANSLIIEDAIPAYTNYKTSTLELNSVSTTDDVADADGGAYYSGDKKVVFELASLNGAGATATASFTVTLDPRFDAAKTYINNIATVSASNASKKTAALVDSVDAAPVLTVTKSGRSAIAYPATTLSANYIGGTTTATVADASLLSINQYVSFNGGSEYARISDISGNTLTLATSMPSGQTSGTNVIGSLTYGLYYENTGTRSATNPTVTDELPAGATFVEANKGGELSGSDVVWDLTDLGVLDPGDFGTVNVTMFLGGTGPHTNTVTLASVPESVTDDDNLTTSAGGLIVAKSTSTPVVVMASQATYTITVKNTLSSSAVSGVVVTDPLPAGFTFLSTTATSIAPVAPLTTPAVGDDTPVWGSFNILASGTLTITYVVDIATWVAPGTYHNPASATNTSGISVKNFDELASGAEDVQITSILINEVMFNPLTGDPQWIELYNTYNGSISLDNMLISDGEFSYTIPPITPDIGPNGYAIIYLSAGTDNTTDNSLFKLYAGAPSAGSLSSEDQLTLYNTNLAATGNVMDFVQWDNDGTLTGNLDDNNAVAAKAWPDGDHVLDVSTIGQGQTIGRDEDSTDRNYNGDWEVPTAANGGGGIDAAHRTDGVQNKTWPLVINEVMIDPLAGESEWIEIYNDSNETILLDRDFVITDGDGFSQTIPAGTEIAPNGYVVIFLEAGVDDTSDPEFVKFYNAAGAGEMDGEDQLYLYSSTTQKEGTMLDFIQWDDNGTLSDSAADDKAQSMGLWPSIDQAIATPLASNAGYSIGRDASSTDTDTIGDWGVTAFGADADYQTQGTQNYTYPVVINEVMYNPATGDEWIELYNPGGSVIDLTDWTLSDGDVGELNYSIPGGLTLGAGEYAVIHMGGDPANNGEIDGVLHLYTGGGGGVLDNTEDQITLFSDDKGTMGFVVDFVQWDDNGTFTDATDDDLAVKAGHWDNSDYAVSSGTAGDTLGRDSTGTDSDQPSDWENDGGSNASRRTDGGANITYPIVVNEVMFDPATGNEWIEFYNTSGSALNIENMVVTDGDGWTYTFPAGTTIGPNGYTILTLGAGAPVIDGNGYALDLYTGDLGAPQLETEDQVSLFSKYTTGCTIVVPGDCLAAGALIDFVQWDTDATLADDTDDDKAALVTEWQTDAYQNVNGIATGQTIGRDGVSTDTEIYTGGDPDNWYVTTGSDTADALRRTDGAANITSPILINEVMFNPATGNEWIELYNPTGSAVSVDNFVLADGAGTGWSYTIPASTDDIPAYGYLVIEIGTTGDGLADLYTGAADGTDQLGSTTDGLGLYHESGLAAGSLVDYVQWGDSGSGGLGDTGWDDKAVRVGEWQGDAYENINGTSSGDTIGRSSTSADNDTYTGADPDDWNTTGGIDAARRTDGAANITYDIVINEVMTDPVLDPTAGTNKGLQWIELHNPTGSDVDITGWILSDGEYDYPIPNDGGSPRTLAAGEYLVVYLGGDPANNTGSVIYTGETGGVPNMSLGITEDQLTLSFDSTDPAAPGAIVDFVQWADTSLGTTTGDDKAARVTEWANNSFENINVLVEGQSIGRDQDSTDSDSNADWEITSGEDAGYQTQGRQNKTFPVVINEVMNNPETGLYEWIELYNYSDTDTVNLDGWLITNGSSFSDTLDYNGSGTTNLAPGEYMLVFFGTGTNTTKILYTGGANNLLDNTEDQLALFSSGAAATTTLIDYVAWDTALNADPSADYYYYDEARSVDQWHTSAITVPPAAEGETMGRDRNSLDNHLAADWENTGGIHAIELSPLARNENSAPTNITVDEFTAVLVGNAVEIAWHTATEINTLGFMLYRANSRLGQYDPLEGSFTVAAGTAFSGMSYHFVDADIALNMEYWYRLDAIESNGATNPFGPISVMTTPSPTTDLALNPGVEVRVLDHNNLEISGELVVTGDVSSPPETTTDTARANMDQSREQPADGDNPEIPSDALIPAETVDTNNSRTPPAADPQNTDRSPSAPWPNESPVTVSVAIVITHVESGLEVLSKTLSIRMTGATQEFTHQLKPNQEWSGWHRIDLTVDPANALPETDETNNRQQLRIYLGWRDQLQLSLERLVESFSRLSATHDETSEREEIRLPQRIVDTARQGLEERVYESDEAYLAVMTEIIGLEKQFLTQFEQIAAPEVFEGYRQLVMALDQLLQKLNYPAPDEKVRKEQ